MIILDRLHRGDTPTMVAVTAMQTEGRLVFTDEAGANAFIEAYQRADPAASFYAFTVPELSLREFWQACHDHDWHFENSDDRRVWREGGAAASRLAVQATTSHEHRRLYREWKRHVFSGPAYKTEKQPMPDQPEESES